MAERSASVLHTRMKSMADEAENVGGAKSRQTAKQYFPIESLSICSGCSAFGSIADIA
jgi:hypothetical protein